MLAFGIHYLNGYVAASEPDSHERPEWPPHPGRVFMALAAAHFETGADPSERQALKWLEDLDSPPQIYAGEASPRTPVTHYVPVNDKARRAKAILQSAPALTRDRQARTFARAWLDEDVVYLSWPEAEPPDATRTALGRLCGKVTRVGHSTSLVHMWLASPDEIKNPTWVPDGERANIELRVAGPGTLEYLERCFNREVVSANDAAKEKLKKEHPGGPPLRRRPELRLFEGYAPPRPPADTAARGTVFSPHLIVRTIERDSGPFQELDLSCTPPLVHRWREAILSQSNDLPDAIRRLLSGHDHEGAPLEEPHLAFVPLAFVGHAHADGHLLGMGIVLPDALDPAARRHALRAVGRVGRILLGRLGTWRIGGVPTTELPWNSRSEVWTAHPRGATHWSSVTPIAFDQHPKERERAAYQQESAAMIARAAVRIGLPEPREVIITAVSAHLGVPPAHAFPRLQRKDGSRRRHTHAILIFGEPVRGPILLGAGRYRGYGVCRPLLDQRAPA